MAIASSGRERSTQAADWALSRGIAAMTTAEVAELLDVPPTQVPQRLSAPRHRGEWVSPARGLWVPVAPEFRGWGGPPATEFIAALAAHLHVDYYVGWLAAAALHGASHQAPQQTHIAVSRLVRDRTVGRARLSFHQRSQLAQLPVVERMARSGAFRVSTTEVTALDLAADLTLASGLDNAATVITDLADVAGLDDQKLAALVGRFPDAAARRVGWIVETHTSQRLDALADAVAGGSPHPVRLLPELPLTGELDRRWRLRLNAAVEVE
jgi:predicted transcriptional regulator of viral defense system